MNKWTRKLRKVSVAAKKKNTGNIGQTRIAQGQLQHLGLNTDNSVPIKTLDVSDFQASVFPELNQKIKGRTIKEVMVDTFAISTALCNLLEGSKVGQKLILRKAYVPIDFTGSAFSDWVAKISEECVIHVEVMNKREESIFSQLLRARCCISNSENFRFKPNRMIKSFHLNKLTMLGNLSSLKIRKVNFPTEDEERRFFRSVEHATPSLKEIQFEPTFIQRTLGEALPSKVDFVRLSYNHHVTVSFSSEDMMSIWRLRLPPTLASIELTISGGEFSSGSLHFFSSRLERSTCAGGPNFPVEINPAYNLTARLYDGLQ